MVIFRNILVITAFIFTTNKINAQQSATDITQNGSNEVTTQKKANSKLEKREVDSASYKITWERTKNPQNKENKAISEEKDLSTNKKTKR